MRRVLRGVGRWLLAVGVCAVGVGLSACGRTDKSNGNSSNGGSTALGGLAGTSAAGGSAHGGDAAGGAKAEPDTQALPSELRRLTAAEYTATVTDVLGTALQPDLTAFSTTVDGFDNNAAKNGVSEDLYQRYLETAEALAAEVFGSDELRRQVVTCATPDDTGCVDQIVSAVGLRLFRRPLLDAELSAYQKVYERARARKLSHELALQDVLIALLASAQFIYRMEFVPDQPGVQPLGPYDVATRLSYLLWSSAPDPQLLDNAAQNQLSSDDELAQTLQRLLQDPRSSRLAQNFAGQWLGARGVPALALDAKMFPEWTPTLAAAAANEVAAFFDDLVRGEQDFPRFLDSPAHFVNPELGQLYGINLEGDTERVEQPGFDRHGFLGLVGFLAQTSHATGNSPSARGAWVLERLLCSPAPPPPPNMPSFDGNDSARAAYLRDLGTQPTCAGCHALFDPLGLALENYDAIGRYREKYDDDTPVDANVTLGGIAGLAGGTQTSGVAGLSGALAASPALERCAVQKLYTYGFGRAYADTERANIDDLATKWQSGSPTLHALLLQLVQSKAFRFRSDGGSK